MSEEMLETAVCSILEPTVGDDKNNEAKYYTLNAIIAVGCRVKPLFATYLKGAE